MFCVEMNKREGSTKLSKTVGPFSTKEDADNWMYAVEDSNIYDEWHMYVKQMDDPVKLIIGMTISDHASSRPYTSLVENMA